MRRRRFAMGLLAAFVVAAGLAALPAATGTAGTASADVAGTAVYQANTGGYDCYRIPAVVKAKNNDLLAFAEGRHTGANCADIGNVDVVLKRSSDNGTTWSAVQMVVQGFGDTKDNAVPIVIPSTGRIVVLSEMQCVSSPSCGRVPRVSYSDDNGKTWTAPKVLTAQLGFTTAPNWLATGPGHGIVLTHGAHAGRIVSGMSYQQTPGTSNIGALIYSDDQGVTWHLGATDVAVDANTLNPQEISVTELSDGRIYAAARNDHKTIPADPCAIHNRAYAISSDGGATFSKKFAVVPDLTTSMVQASVMEMSATTSGAKYNRLVFAGPSTCDRRKELRVRSSFDEGGSWTSDANSLLVWSQDASYTDMISLSQTSVGLLYEAGPAFQADASIRWSTVSEAQLGAPACGTGYDVIDSSPLGTAGTVYLSYNAANGQNCVGTMKSTGAGTPSQTSAYVQVEGATRKTDAGSFSWYAGPVLASAPGKCVYWGGAIAGATPFDSKLSHCG
jgi:sialidase-1